MEKINFINNVTKANADTFNTMQDNIEDAIDEAQLDIYSTTETRIGTWIDGKPLYRKVFTISNPQSTNTNYEDVSNLHIQTLVHLYGYYRNGAGTFGIPFTDSTSNFSVIFVNSANQLRGRFAADSIAGMQDIKVVLEYTKTTD